MGEAYGHEMLNHLGHRIRVSARTLRALDMRHYLRRDNTTRLLSLPSKFHPILLAIENGDHRPAFMRELGADISGPAVCVCRCFECQRKQSDIDHTPLPGRNKLDSDKASAIVREVKARRRHKI